MSLWQIKQTWVREYNGIEKTELNNINVDVTQLFNQLQQARHELGVPSDVNTLLR